MNIIRSTGYFLLPLLILNIYASAIDDNCFRFFGFKDKLDQPGEIENIVNNGWELDTVNQSLRSGLKGESSFSIQEYGPIVISFDYKTSTIEEGVGVFQFLIDGKQQSLKKKMDWNPYQISAIGNGSHELKWIVYKGKNPFVVWIDSLCINNISIPVPTKYTSATMLNQGPIKRNLPANVTNSYDAENGQLFFKNDTGQERNEVWNLPLAKNNTSIIINRNK